MFSRGRLRMRMMTRRMMIAIAARVRVVMMGSAAGRCICVREAAPAGAAVVIVRIRRGRSGAVSGQRTRRCHRSRRGGEGGHLSLIRTIGMAGCKRAKQGPGARRVRVICYAKSKASQLLMEQASRESERYFFDVTRSKTGHQILDQTAIVSCRYR